MTHLRRIMLEELQRRNYSEATTRYYIRKVEAFARYFQCSPDRLGPQHIREYQAHLFAKRKLSPGTVTTHLCALRFFYIQTLKKPWSIADTPYPKKAHRLPTILSQEEVAQLIDAACTPFHRPASAANPSGFLLTALSNARRLAFLASTLLREGARPIKHLRHPSPTGGKHHPIFRFPNWALWLWGKIALSE